MTNLFATAKKIETKTSASTKQKERITVAGIEADLIRYEKIKRDEANLKSEKEMIGGRLKDFAKEEFMKMYLKQKSRPDSFNMVDGDGRILVIVMDAYKKVEEAKGRVREATTPMIKGAAMSSSRMAIRTLA